MAWKEKQKKIIFYMYVLKKSLLESFINYGIKWVRKVYFKTFISLHCLKGVTG